MADLKEPFELCRVLQNGSLIGISRHAGGDNVLITFRDRGVVAYNVSNKAFVRKKVETFRIVHNLSNYMYVNTSFAVEQDLNY